MGWDYNGEDFTHEEGWTMTHVGVQGYGSERMKRGGMTVLEYQMARLKPDVYISLIDPWFIGHAVVSTNQLGIPYLAYLPVDGDPLSFSWKDILKMLHTPVWMSNYGAAQWDRFCETYNSKGSATEIIRDPALDCRADQENAVIYHGVDLETFHPLTTEEKKMKRIRLGIDFDTLFLSVGRNTNRKQIPRLLDAFRLMLDKHPEPEKVGLMLHVGDPTDTMGMGGWNLEMLVQEKGLHDNVAFTDNSDNPLFGLSREEMAQLYQLSDVHILTTGGEGFGIPTAEAMACGLPVILPDNSTGPELVGEDERGLLVPCVTKITGPRWGVDLGLVDIEACADAMLTLALDPELRQGLGEAGRKFAEERFDWEKLTDQFESLIAKALAEGHPLGNNARAML